MLRPTKASSLARTSILECGREAPSQPEEDATSTFKNDVAEKEAEVPRWGFFCAPRVGMGQKISHQRAHPRVGT